MAKKIKETKGTLELRVTSLGVETRADDGEGSSPVIVGYAAVFDSPTDLGWFTESVARGAFTDTIKNDDVRALVDHDPSRIIGRTSAGTLALSEDKKGLHMEITPADTTVGRDILESVARGDVDGASFSFDVLEEKWERSDKDDDDGEGRSKEHRTLLRVKLYDVGPVSFPAYDDTVVSTRSWERFKEETKEEGNDDGESSGSTPADYAPFRTRLRELEG